MPGCVCSRHPPEAEVEDDFSTAAAPPPDPSPENSAAWASSPAAPLPPNEEQRLCALASCKCLDTAEEQRFNSIVTLLRDLFQATAAAVSLVDRNRLWLKAAAGYSAKELDRHATCCTWTLLPEVPTMLVVEDTLMDARFRKGALVLGPPYIRFYAGAPLIGSDGARYGSLCIVDVKPRSMSVESCNIMCNLAELVVRELEEGRMSELRQKDLQAKQQNQALLRSLSRHSDGVAVVDARSGNWIVHYMNDAFTEITGIQPPSLPATEGLWEHFEFVSATSMGLPLRTYNDAIDAGDPFSLVVAPKGRPDQRLQLSYRTAASQFLSGAPLIAVPSFVGHTHGASSGGPMVQELSFVTISPAVASAGSSPDSSAGHVVHAQVPAQKAESGAINPQKALISQEPGTQGACVSPRIAALRDTVKPMGSMAAEKLIPSVKLGVFMGAGSYGKTYRGLWKGAPVAVKIIKLVLEPGNQVQEDAVRGALEGRESIRHPCLCQTWEWCCRPVGGADLEADKGVPHELWLVTELSNRGSLRDAIDRGRLRPKPGEGMPCLASVLRTAQEIAAACSYLHDNGIVHGDLNSHNVVLTASAKDNRKFNVQVTHFGLHALPVPGASSPSLSTLIASAPEVLEAGAERPTALHPSSDVYSFGVLLWEMWCGQHPFLGLDAPKLIELVTSAKQFPLAMPPGTPQQLVDLLQACVCYEPSQRPSFDLILERLSAMLEDLCPGE